MRMTLRGAAVAALLLLVPMTAIAAAPAGRVRTSLDAGWRFHLGDYPPVPPGSAIMNWRWTPDDQAEADAATMAAPGLDTTGSAWQDAAPGQDTFHGRIGYSWYRAILPDASGPHRVLHFDGVDDNAVVYVNGSRLLAHEGYDDPFDVPLDSVWKDGGPNEVAVLVQNTAGPGSISGTQVRTVTNAPAASTLPGFNDRSWRIVHLPHDFVVEGTFTPTADGSHGFLPTGVAWYRKTFTLPVADRAKDIWIDFDGVYRDSTVWLNGQKLGEHQSGYIGFRYNISDRAKFGAPNTLAVRVDARKSEGWWYEGGGIYRHVWLTVSDPVHIAPWGVYVTSAVHGVDPTGVKKAAPGMVPSATLSVNTDLVDDTPATKSVMVVSQVYGPDGALCAKSAQPVVVSGRSGAALRTTIAIPRAELWSVDSPNLYRLHTAVQENGAPIDSVDTPFGIRTEYFDADRGFFLNGKHVKLQGVCNHQDFAGVGIALPDTLFKYRIQRMKWLGCNAFRTSHNPIASELLDECDRQGILVMDENRHLGDTYASKSSSGTGYSDLSDLKDMILRDRNHPSIIMWSLCNEEFGLQATAEGARIFSAMMNVVRPLDRTRPISCAMNGGQDSTVGIASVEDLVGFNYNPWAYPRYHAANPAKKMFGSEVGSTVSTRGIYDMTAFTMGDDTRTVFHGDKQAGYVNAYDDNAPAWAQTAEVTWQALDSSPFMAGGFVWTGFDYRGEPTPFGWPCVNSHFGILDMCGFAKDDGYYYRSVWGSAPMVHILPHWNWTGHEGQPVPVWCYSNAQKVELFLNGKSLGAQPMPRDGHVEWSVPYAPGELVAKGYSNGKVIAVDKVDTTGAPVAIRLTADLSGDLSANGEDTMPVTVAVVDSEGRVVPTASNMVVFHVAGAGHMNGVGNGDPSCHEPDRAAQRSAFNGLCMALVQAGDTPGTMTLTATSTGLKSATLTVKAR